MKLINTKTITLLLVGLFFICFVSIASAQERKTNLGEIVVRFCNDTRVEGGTKSLALRTEPNKSEEICMYLDNSGPTPVIIGVSFVDGTVTADSDARKACEPEGANKNFGQYVKAESTGFIIQPGGTLKTKAMLKFPQGVAGIINGCVTYYIIDDTLSGQNQGMFKIISRRANFIDVYVSGVIIFDIRYFATNNPSFPNVSRNEYMGLYMHPISKLYSLKSTIVNSGNIPSLSTISGTISARFGRVQDDILVRQLKISSKQESVYEYELPWRVEYGGPVVAKLHVIDKPDIPESVNNNKLKPVEHEFIISAFILPRRIIGALAIILALLAYSLRKGKK